MKEYFKMWLYGMADIDIVSGKIEDLKEAYRLELLIKAVWSINDRWLQAKNNKFPKIIMTPEGFDLFISKAIIHFSNSQCSNKEALTKVLKYIFNQKDNK
ncbi:unnamed protein product [marine sediment metagenome]|uniref:Uncharacterized protein n=1 Tax=marine sediment metagenome TaxID=412755 RepID=X1DDY6_9ZZZZ